MDRKAAMIIRTLLMLCVVMLCLAPLACETRESVIRPLTETDVAALQVATEQYRDAEAVNDWRAVTMLYTDDAIRMLPRGPTIQGREAILQEFESRPYAVVEYDQRMEEVDGFGDLAFVRGVFSYVVDIDGELSSGTGKYIAIYRRQSDGSWLIDRDIFNLDRPASRRTPPV
jgi:ketosteroid isomerase-like protein